MEPVTSKLRRTRLFANLPESGLADLISDPGVRSGDLAEIVDAEPGDLIVLLEGGLHMLAKDGHGEHLAILSVNESAPEPAILYTIPPGATVRLTRFSTYLVIHGDLLDKLLSPRQSDLTLADLEGPVRDRATALMRSQPFRQLTFNQLVRSAESMQTWTVGAGEDVIVEGDPGDFFYVLESGQAEVVQHGRSVARLGPGASFGEEALLHDGARNATVRMITEGRLLRLSQSDFDRLLRTELVSELEADEVRRRLERGAVEIVDCRTDEEWELWRLPNARLIPLTELRPRLSGLDRSREYVVYCRTGRRAAAAAFLMRQNGLKAVILKGGITAWPYAVEGLATGG